MMKVSFRVSLCALTCFIASLLLPAVRLIVFGPATLSGWEAIICAVSIGKDAFVQPATETLWIEVGAIALGFAGILNIVFIVTPLVLIWGAPARKIWYMSGSAVLAGFLFTLIAPFAFYLSFKTYPEVLAGYFALLAGYIMLIVAFFLARK